MLRGFVVGVGAAVAVSGAAGCYINTSGRIIAAPPSDVFAAVPVSADAASVSVDGWPRDIRGTVTCTPGINGLHITVGEADTGIAVMLTPDASTVIAVELGEVYGVLMGHRHGPHGGQATATKTGRTYTITGTATGVAVTNLMAPIQRPFEITVTCP